MVKTTKAIAKPKVTGKKPAVKPAAKRVEKEDTGLFSLLKEIATNNKIEDKGVEKFIADMRDTAEKKKPFLEEDKVCIFLKINGMPIDKKIKDEMILSLDQDFEDMDESNTENGHMVFN